MYTDIRPEHWTLRALPPVLRPYGRLTRLDRPIGWWLLLLPCWWSLALAFSTGGYEARWPRFFCLFFLFWAGAVIMRGAGCLINDMWDRDLDRQVERTQTRPLASGEVSLPQALMATALLLFLGLLVLLQFNAITIWWALGSLVLVVLYPLAKRFTYWPQLVLGLTFNWGAFLGWTSINELVSMPALCLYLSGIFWTLSYDTVYAHQDKVDDLEVGIKSTAVKLGASSKKWFHLFTAMQVCFLLAAGAFSGADFTFYGIALLACAWMLIMIWRVNLDTPSACIAYFRAQRNVGLLILCACLWA